jgi:hypothetical protein
MTRADEINARLSIIPHEQLGADCCGCVVVLPFHNNLTWEAPRVRGPGTGASVQLIGSSTVLLVRFCGDLRGRGIMIEVDA